MLNSGAEIGGETYMLVGKTLSLKELKGSFTLR